MGSGREGRVGRGGCVWGGEGGRLCRPASLGVAGRFPEPRGAVLWGGAGSLCVESGGGEKGRRCRPASLGEKCK